MPEYNKLVRNKIPEIIEADGKIPVTLTLDDNKEFLHALIEKIVEEGAELAIAETPEEQVEEKADLLEVAKAIVELLSTEEIETARIKKFEERGGFNQRIFLERTN